MMSNKNGTPPSPRYLTILCEFMGFFHEKPKPYPKDHEFSEDELSAITPTDICKWMNAKAFSTPNPSPDAKLTGSGSSSLDFFKKALSFYMPLKDNWDVEQRRGNPTRSQQVKELLHRVAALGGKARKKEADQDNNTIPMELSDGPHGLLQRMHTQNSEFINILNTMGSALQTFSRSVGQMKSALETNNIAIRHELANGANDDDDDMKEAAAVAETIAEEMPDIPAIDTEMKEDVARVAETLQEFMNTNVVTNRDLRILSGADGFCTFGSNIAGNKQMDVPDGFDLPSVDLIRAWRHWITGFPDFKVKNDNGDIVDTPIRPLRFVNTSDLPQTLKKKFKDGWRPILLSMQGDVAQMLETTPIAAMDEKFVNESYNMAMSSLVAKAPGIFAESNADKCGTWKVATWSRKIREQQLGQQQVRRRQDSSGATTLRMEEVQLQPPSLTLELKTEEHATQPSL
mmetsp:Transcript_3052/g.6699  ORF Transcript_3052/g.6699 Transcript_3052/m.6699 type:complete len:458 (+) Transcript_3052:253-1626(+)|eukprot:CAMPEP_0172316734 /NCGR_PEP_ID=MMETSP1058-20130122/29335_1 /TAXON_ID=83371 /ORGANISM="Detonula confervacea, Strain CCMP 353" /LENGTH=457 /DNA_ID=CAMNT_0013031131 /DNA_START=200 /DNA_END=1573 /DNA_ORIENTATION=+